MLEPGYKQRFTDFEEWQSAIAKDPTIFNAHIHVKPDAEMGRFWSPKTDAYEATLEEAIALRQLEPSAYADGALRVHVSPQNAATMEFHKPTAFDSILFDRWQVPERKGSWGKITTKRLATNETIVIREAVTNPVTRTMISNYEPMLPSTVSPSNPVRSIAPAMSGTRP
jgi:hypothetical protein